MSGLIHIYTGEGKGKTTAAMGLAIRAAGSGKRVLIAQFLKNAGSCELKILRQIKEIELYSYNKKIKFIKYMSDEEKLQTAIDTKAYFDRVIEKSFDKDVLIMDEFMAAYNYEMLDRERSVAFLKNKPEQLEVVLTGRNAPAEVRELADYISNIQKERHPFDKGIAARRGIEL